MNPAYESEGKERENKDRICLVIMPAYDNLPYESGHFNLVYEYMIKPACIKAGFIAQRLQTTYRLKHISINDLKAVVTSEVAICDLSSNNSEVLYQLGIRQGFDLPTLLLKDTLTNRIFDIRSFQDIEYDENLRIDRVNKTIDEISLALTTLINSDDKSLNSVSSLLGIHKNAPKSRAELSAEANILLEAISGVKDHLLKSETTPQASVEVKEAVETKEEPKNKSELDWTDNEGNKFRIGDVVTHPKYGLGILIDIIPDGLLRVKFNTIGLKVLRGEVEKLVLL
jgi:hypothetical protein